MPTIGADRQREDEERDERQQPVLVEHDADQEDDGHRILADPAEDIGRGAAQQRASLVKREISVPVGLA